MSATDATNTQAAAATENERPKSPYPFDEISPTASGPFTAHCQCGSVIIEVPKLPPVVNECRCSICYRYGTIWAYYDSSTIKVTVNGQAIDFGKDPHPRKRADGVADYRWNLEFLEFGHCDKCGCVIYWCLTQKGLDYVAAQEDDGQGKFDCGVNARWFGWKAIDPIPRKHPNDK